MQVTTSDIEAWLKEHYPTKQWVVSDVLGVGLPMFDGVGFYARVTGDIAQTAQYVIQMTEGKKTL